MKSTSCSVFLNRTSVHVLNTSNKNEYIVDVGRRSLHAHHLHVSHRVARVACKSHMGNTQIPRAQSFLSIDFSYPMIHEISSPYLMACAIPRMIKKIC